MTELEDSILQTLVELDEKVRLMAVSNPKPNLLPIFSKLDQLAAQLPAGTDPDLVHYLSRKSYEKARLLLEGRKTETKRGTCGR